MKEELTASPLANSWQRWRPRARVSQCFAAAGPVRAAVRPGRSRPTPFSFVAVRETPAHSWTQPANASSLSVGIGRRSLPAAKVQ
jgi:hypothetical protein